MYFHIAVANEHANTITLRKFHEPHLFSTYAINWMHASISRTRQTVMSCKALLQASMIMLFYMHLTRSSRCWLAAEAWLDDLQLARALAQDHAGQGSDGGSLEGSERPWPCNQASLKSTRCWLCPKEDLMSSALFPSRPAVTALVCMHPALQRPHCLLLYKRPHPHGDHHAADCQMRIECMGILAECPWRHADLGLTRICCRRF